MDNSCGAKATCRAGWEPVDNAGRNSLKLMIMENSMNTSGPRAKGRLGGIVGVVVGGLLALVVIWHKSYGASEMLSTLLVVGLPWGGGVVGNYIQRKYFLAKGQ